MRRKRPRPPPPIFRALRSAAKLRKKGTVGYARFYALFEDIRGKKKRASFAVRVRSKYLASTSQRRALMRWIRTVCNAMLDNTMPVHKYGQRFKSFRELLKETKWVEIRRLLDYRAGVVYVR